MELVFKWFHWYKHKVSRKGRPGREIYRAVGGHQNGCRTCARAAGRCCILEVNGPAASAAIVTLGWRSAPLELLKPPCQFVQFVLHCWLACCAGLGHAGQAADVHLAIPASCPTTAAASAAPSAGIGGGRRC